MHFFNLSASCFVADFHSAISLFFKWARFVRSVVSSWAWLMLVAAAGLQSRDARRQTRAAHDREDQSAQQAQDREDQSAQQGKPATPALHHRGRMKQREREGPGAALLSARSAAVSAPVVCGRLPFYSSLDELDVVPDITVANNVRLPPPPNTMLRFDKSQDCFFAKNRDHRHQHCTGGRGWTNFIDEG